MSLPKAYDPEYGYKYQILVRFGGQREYEHCDYAIDLADKKHLLENYRLAYKGTGASFNVIQLPQKYWPKKKGGR